MESLIGERIMNEIMSNNELFQEQYGFRRRSTLAMMRVKEIAFRANMGTWTTDSVKNAFNSIPWQGIVRKLVRRGVSSYVIRIIGSYRSG